MAGICLGVSVGVAVILAARWQHAASAPAAAPVDAATIVIVPPPPAREIRSADFGGASASADVRYIADWIADSGDANGSAFVIVDKKGAQVYVFNGQARLLGETPVLLGAAPGDDTVPGIGSRPLTEVSMAERTTPAGRFVGERGHNARGEDVVWVDYDAAVSMHRVLTTNPDEHRLERLATPTIEDNRVSYGCINVPVAFYETFLQPAFAHQRAIVYVLPEFKSLQQVFGAYDVAARALQRKTRSAATP